MIAAGTGAATGFRIRFRPETAPKLVRHGSCIVPVVTVSCFRKESASMAARKKATKKKGTKKKATKKKGTKKK